jgi:O-antigen ligase
MMIYIMMGAVIVLVLGVQEWLEKRGASSIEKARLLGPQMQPNDFGAFMAYASAPFLALLLSNLGSLRAWLAALPYLAMSARILIATFSRGAYLGMGLAAIVAAYLRGKLFILFVAVVGLILVTAVPEIVPGSMRARMAQTSYSSAGGEEKLDGSVQTRFILWDAALKMTLESPIFGWGFKAFPKFKGQFTATEVEESDNHNMYLYLSSQMGIPAVLLLGLILWRMYSLGARLYRHGRDSFTRSIGMTAGALAAAAFLVNMFGSRMVDICVTAPFWIIFAIVSRLSMELQVQQERENA